MSGPTYGVKSIRPKKKYLSINLIDLIQNPINRITFLRNTRQLQKKKKNTCMRCNSCTQEFV
ncbi:hypothetical protein ACS0TY_008146 [Phlomoides rotata]